MDEIKPRAWAYTDRKGWKQALFGDEPHDLYACEPLFDLAAIDAAVAAERERCARVCEDLDKEYECDSLYAEAIRAQVPSAQPTAEPR